MAIGEGAVGYVEFVGHYEVVFGAVDEGFGGAEMFGCVFVDPTGVYDAGGRGEEDD